MKKNSSALLYFLFVSSTILVSCVADEGLSNSDPEISNQTFDVSESAGDGELVGTISASDDDGDDLKFTLLTGNTNSIFTLNPNSGELTVAISTELNFDITPSYNLTVQVSDGKESASATVTVNVADGGDPTPVDENAPPTIEDQTFEIIEGSHHSGDIIIGIVEASDADEDELFFSILGGNEDEIFNIDGETGELGFADDGFGTGTGFLDFETTPTYTFKVLVTDFVDESVADITINILDDPRDNFFTTEAEVLDGLADAYTLFSDFIEYSFLFDAVYSNTISSPSSEWEAVYNHTLTASNEKVQKLWDDAYELIFLSNNLVESYNLVTADAEAIAGQAYIFRAAAYLQLINWFGEVPLEFYILSGNEPWSVIEELLDWSLNDLNTAESILSSDLAQDGNGNFILTDNLAKALKLRALVLLEDYSQIRAIATDLIGFGWTLNETDYFQFDTDLEIIWGFDKSSGTEFTNLFTKGDYVPLYRITEAFLIDLEARAFLGEESDQTTEERLIQLLLRDDPTSTLTPPFTANEIIDHVYQLYRDEMHFEGIDFFTLKRFEMATTELGIADFRLRLPIPQSVVDSNENAVQNPGY